MEKAVTIRSMTLGEGRPKICIPLTGSDDTALKEAVRRLLKAPFDFVEWRADFYSELRTEGRLLKAAELLRNALKETPLLFTLRTSVEMGELDIDTDSYLRLNLAAIKSGQIDLVDAELSRGEETMRTLVTAAHKAGVRVVGSRHDFASTPDRQEIVETLRRMQALGCDVAKFAAMPRTEHDVLTLLEATLAMREQPDGTPVITMSMGKLGMISRLCGGVFGSCATFATAGSSSAPGQLPAALLPPVLEALSGNF